MSTTLPDHCPSAKGRTDAANAPLRTRRDSPGTKQLINPQALLATYSTVSGNASCMSDMAEADTNNEMLPSSSVGEESTTIEHASRDLAQPAPKPSQIYAFLNHSTATVSDNLPPKVDDKSLARQRRRRTSPEDQAVLEAAFRTNSKPDKAARLEIVKHVALGEKEVQIWFQNRRQSSRRKSRPLLPHEIAQFQMSRGFINHSFSGGEADDSSFEDLTHDNADESWVDQRGLDSTENNVNAGATVEGRVEPDLHPSENPQRVPSLANRRSAPSLRTYQSAEAACTTSTAGQPSGPRGPLKKSSSIMRLSMGSDGKASIVTKDTTSPSPPRPVQTIGGERGDLPSLTTLISSDRPVPTLAPLKRSSSGRSRDSRAWEFWCDKDARTELEDKAEKDAQGSAADAIGLLRSNSGRRILGPISSKRNSLLPRQSVGIKRTKLDVSIPSLSKASTSHGRLQHDQEKGGATASKPSLQSHKSGTSINITGNDSDKENWSPDSEWHRSDLRHNDLSESFSSKQRRAARDDPDADPEVEAFMRSGRRSSNVSGEEEMDCVQGLLSLSQGNWR